MMLAPLAFPGLTLASIPRVLGPRHGKSGEREPWVYLALPFTSPRCLVSVVLAKSAG